MDYISSLRSKIGHDVIINVGVRVFIERGDSLLLMKRKDFDMWGFPGGGVEIGESVYDCLVRETKEEVDVDVLSYEFIGISSDPNIESVTYPNNDRVQNVALIFVVDKFHGEIKNSLESTELRFFEWNVLPKILPNENKSLDIYENYKNNKSITIE